MQLVKDVNLTNAVEVQVMMIVRRPMMYAVGRRDFVKRSSAIGSSRSVTLHVVVLNGRSPIAVLTGRPHVLRDVYPSKDMRVILEYSRRLCS